MKSPWSPLVAALLLLAVVLNISVAVYAAQDASSTGTAVMLGLVASFFTMCLEVIAGLLLTMAWTSIHDVIQERR